MLNVWLARHGEAVDPDRTGSDFDRTLTSLGRHRLTEMAEWFVGREKAPELFLHSPLVRARQTAESLASGFSAPPAAIRVESRLAPGIDIDELLKVLAQSAVETVVCVCHQPDVSRCFAEMIGGGHAIYSPGTIAKIEFGGPIVRHGGHLRWMVDPRWFG